jgi:hypothetical protein
MLTAARAIRGGPVFCTLAGGGVFDRYVRMMLQRAAGSHP